MAGVRLFESIEVVELTWAAPGGLDCYGGWRGVDIWHRRGISSRNKKAWWWSEGAVKTPLCYRQGHQRRVCVVGLGYNCWLRRSIHVPNVHAILWMVRISRGRRSLLDDDRSGEQICHKRNGSSGPGSRGMQ